MGLPIQDLKSVSQHYNVRNISSSQEMRHSKLERSTDSPRIINSSEMIDLMNKNATRLFSRKRDALKDYKQRKESLSRESKHES
jgi:hypothetical protein